MRFKPSSTSCALLLLVIATVIAGCGKTGPEATAPGGGPIRKVAPVAEQGAVSVTTRNTTRVGGASTAVDAAAVARVVYPGLTQGSRPETVVLADASNWPAALAASSLAAAPLNAPVLFAEGDTLPKVSLEALEAMHPTGAGPLGAQVLEVGTRAALPAGFSVHAVPAGEPAEEADALEQLLVQATGAAPAAALVVASSTPRALQMPSAGLAAESAAPILFAAAGGVPAPTRSVLHRLHHPSIYVLGAAALGRATLGELARLGRVTRIPEAGEGEAPTPAAAAIATARFTDGTFGWGVKDPGHGLVFANSARPLDAPAAALLSATGEYGPLLLLEDPNRIPPGLAAYLGDIQPAYTSAPEFRPVHGVYNHGWLIGDERAVSLVTQAEIDSLLEISPRKQAGAEETSATSAE